MAADPSQASSIQARIAALNLGHVGRAPITATPLDDDPVSRPRLAPRRQTANLPGTVSNDHHINNGVGNEPNGCVHNGVLPPPSITRTGQKKPPPPALPPRKQSSQYSPALPPRRPSILQRRDSAESISSTISSVSAISVGTNGTARTPGSRTPSMDSGRKLAPVFDPAQLPPLPPKRTPEQVEKRYQDIERSRMGLKPTKSTPSMTTNEVVIPPSLPSRPLQRPPQTPMRKESTEAVRKLPSERPPAKPARSALSLGMNKPEEKSGANGVNGITPGIGPTDAEPPPLPLSSKPDLSKLLATKPKPSSNSQPPSQTISAACLTCRDFSGPDNHAAKFPRETVPSIDWLANQLATPFSSPTDQARAIFTWLHHNIAYDIISFCNDAVKPSTPANTLATGLAVCEGYASLFTAIASKVGLESLVVSGHGKGAGFSPLEPGESIPPESSNHAWNAVKVDGGEWKLIDTCWGAGHVCLNEQKYTKKFAPRHFTMGNNEFGLRHFPTNKALFYRTDGRAQISWDEYLIGPSQEFAPVGVCEITTEEEGIDATSVRPSNFHIPLSPNKIVRFQFRKVCDHWEPVRNGPSDYYPYVLIINNADGNGSRENKVLDTDGTMWWLDIESRLLGQKGQTLKLCPLTTVDGRSARGMGVEECRKWFAARKAKSWAYGSLGTWELI
ncbi:MAG: hypothetical protein Q9201_002072 [Fulgogasparrea decipioides]